MSVTRTRTLAAVLAALAVAAVPMVAQAKNADPKARARFVGHIAVSGKTATLTVRYACGSGQALWVSAKQAASGKRDVRLPKEGSSRVSAAWWQSHRNRFTCDGRSHTATFTIDTVEKGSKGTLRPGSAWVQFCVTKGDRTLILSKSGWVTVR